MLYDVAHKIELKPKDNQFAYFNQAFGCHRLAFNWGLHRMIDDYGAYMTA